MRCGEAGGTRGVSERLKPPGEEGGFVSFTGESESEEEESRVTGEGGGVWEGEEVGVFMEEDEESRV